MKRKEKGTPGYLDYKKKAEIARTVLYFAIVAAILLLGYSQTHTKKNLLTVVGIVGCLPACKALVGVITRLPYRSTEPRLAQEVQQKADLLTTVFDLVVTSTETIMPIDCLVISGDKVFGYVSSPKVNVDDTAKYLQTMLRGNQFPDASVKLFGRYKAFLARAEGLNHIQSVEKTDSKAYEEEIRRAILSLSL